MVHTWCNQGHGVYCPVYRIRWCTPGVTKAMVYTVLSVGWCTPGVTKAMVYTVLSIGSAGAQMV